MGKFVGGFLGNDSPFGRVMNVFYIIFVTNLLFVICLLPVVTTGAGLTASYHVLIKALRNDGDISPTREFWKGLKGNFVQATAAWLILCAIGGVLYADMRIISASNGALDVFKYLVYGLTVVVVFGAVYIFPVIAAFRNTLGRLIFTAYYFAIKNPIRTIVMIVVPAFFAFWIYVDAERRPIFAFCFFFFGFAAIVGLGAWMLLKDFSSILDQETALNGSGDNMGGENNGDYCA